MPFTGAAKTTYESGQLKTVSNFIDGETQGLGEEYYEGGQLKSKFNLADGKLHGPHETYYENGQLKYKWNYEDGKMHGCRKIMKKTARWHFQSSMKTVCMFRTDGHLNSRSSK